MLAMFLESSGYPVRTAADGWEALTAAREHQPALILLDLMMPRLSGTQFRHEQLQDPDIAEIPVVVVSAHPDARKIAGSMGAIECLQKPMPFERLIPLVEQYCQH